MMTNASQAAPTLSEECFVEIMTAIADGKYSWACVLILRSAGYNPIHYIPLRTYKRLIKLNKTKVSKASKPNTSGVALDTTKHHQYPEHKHSVTSDPVPRKSRERISDLEHLGPCEELESLVKGGLMQLDWQEMTQTIHPLTWLY